MNIDEAVRAIESSSEFKLLRRLNGPTEWNLKGANLTALTGLYVDVETTGLSTSKDEIVELCLLPFSYDPTTGEILDVDMANAIDELSDPGIPIPVEATQVHGITDEDVAGKTINSKAVRRLASRADIIISHNAGFDRRFLERAWPIFVDKPWGCSLTDIDWRSFSIGSGKLDYLVMKLGYFFDGHRALNDCLAGVFLLKNNLPELDTPIMGELLRNARKIETKIEAQGAPFDLKEMLKMRGYRWQPVDRVWWIITSEREAELHWLEEHIYKRKVDLPTQEVNAFNRFSDRA